jgi:hypothetical protein
MSEKTPTKTSAEISDNGLDFWLENVIEGKIQTYKIVVPRSVKAVQYTEDNCRFIHAWMKIPHPVIFDCRAGIEVSIEGDWETAEF